MASPSGGYNVKDASLITTLALPSSANTTVNSSSGIDLEVSSLGDFLANTDVLVSAPALNATQLPNNATMTYNVIVSNSANMASPVVVQASVIVQTGSSGAAAVLDRIRLPSNVGVSGRYLGLQEVGAAGNGNCAAASGTMQLLF